MYHWLFHIWGFLTGVLIGAWITGRKKPFPERVGPVAYPSAAVRIVPPAMPQKHHHFKLVNSNLWRGVYTYKCRCGAFYSTQPITREFKLTESHMPERYPCQSKS